MPSRKGNKHDQNPAQDHTLQNRSQSQNWCSGTEVVIVVMVVAEVMVVVAAVVLAVVAVSVEITEAEAAGVATAVIALSSGIGSGSGTHSPTIAISSMSIRCGDRPQARRVNIAPYFMVPQVTSTSIAP